MLRIDLLFSLIHSLLITRSYCENINAGHPAHWCGDNSEDLISVLMELTVERKGGTDCSKQVILFIVVQKRCDKVL